MGKDGKFVTTTVMELETETKHPSTAELGAGSRNSSAHDARSTVDSECLEHRNAEFAAMLKVLVEF